MSSSLSVNKNHSKKGSSCRERDKNKPLASESGGSSQCDTPPLTEKEACAGRYAGIGAETVLCAAEQLGICAGPGGAGGGVMELSAEAAATLAEDVSYKLRQLIATVALTSSLSKRSRVEPLDVNAGLTRAELSAHAAPPPLAACLALPHPHQAFHAPVETAVAVSSVALERLTCTLATPPSLTCEWVPASAATTAALHHYYTKIARAVLCGGEAARALALADVGRNHRIGLVLPNLVNLGVLVLNEDNLAALHVPAKRPLQRRVLRLLTALAHNEAVSDTALAQQFQRLFPVMVSAALGGGRLAPPMLATLAHVTRRAPVFSHIGGAMLSEYVAGGGADGARLTAPTLRVAAVLGREAVVSLLAPHLDGLDARGPCVRVALTEVAAVVMAAERTTALEDAVATDYAMYCLLGDSVAPHRRLQPATPPRKETSPPPRAPAPPPRMRRLPPLPRRPGRPLHDVFDVGAGLRRRMIRVVLRGCRSRSSAFPAPPPPAPPAPCPAPLVAAARLDRFRFRLRTTPHFPIYGALQL